MNIEDEKMLNQLVEESKKRDAEHLFYKREQAEKVISARNYMNEIVERFQTYASENQSKLVGKKLFLVDGGCSKVLTDFIENFKEAFDLNYDVRGLQWLYMEKSYKWTNLKISICVNGGKSAVGQKEFNTSYCTYVRESYSDLLLIDEDNKFVSVDIEPRNKKVYSFEAYNEAKNGIAELELQIEALKNQISALKSDMPSELR